MKAVTMSVQTEPIAVKFPLSGEWCAVNTPGFRIPSHGTDQLGQRYAYDFLQIDWNKEKGYKFYRKRFLKSLLFGVSLKDTYCWSKPVYAPFDGEVVESQDGCREREPVHFARDLAIVIKNAFFFKAERNEDLHPILGNYIILKGEGYFALIAHARNGSIKVSKGMIVTEGQMLAEVGHSGNSTAPHLHFQLMDSLNLIQAKGIPCCFKEYESYKEDKWVPVKDGIPGKRERISA